ncbi:LytR/AlgR family response regulator transcription factor [Pedobacter duraquae]|uniref:LytTR family two component transcriptional regulator n=1 Tax=Pedobacter duraquae TaxID=425511 RepID=A0A4R6IK56_9SPHI|nr:LytTR family DNA-binding domain-containing protein [Pedobacter duraquae]TDO22444.1 LytTR family two component transcriptional regulator [Pedobacter duraquae]
MNCLIVDDELLAVELIEDNLRKIPFLKHVASCRNAIDALHVVREQQIDLIFLDIKMPGISGLEFIQAMEKPPMIVLITAFEHYALEAFNLNVVDYLVKPVNFARFFSAVGKAHDLFTLRNKPAIQMPSSESHFFVNAGYSLVKIRMTDIAYIEGLKDYVKIILVNDKPVITRINLKDLTEKLPQHDFMRVHRSFIIALDKIESVQKYQVIIRKAEIPIGESYRETLMEYINTRNF